MTVKPDVSQPTRNPGFDGMHAKRRGEPIDVCPYEPGAQRTAWVIGWYITETEKSDVKSN